MRILSGVQPSGLLHLGNYFGAIKQHIELQEEGECYYFIANYHSLTSLRDAEALREYTHDVALTYLSVGLDPKRTVFYRQSDVPEVCELTWLLSTVTGMGLLERGHSYKEKVARGITPAVGLFSYPILMAADILAPQADMVPVGQDQDQHIEMARDMASAFNNAFCPEDEPVFKLPKSRFSKTPRVPGTTFEKGTALQTVVEVAPVNSDGSPFNAEAYVADYRAMVESVLGAAGEGELQTTEELARKIDSEHGARFPNVDVKERILRVAAELPTEDIIATSRGATLGVEFWTQMDRVVFNTREQKRQAAKMSKSAGNTIEMFAEGKPLKKRVMGIETRLVELEDALDHSEDIVIQLYSLFASDDEMAEMRTNYEKGGFGFGNAKKALLAKINEHFEPFRERRKELENDRDYVEDVLRDGAERARKVIGETTERARRACGIS